MSFFMADYRAGSNRLEIRNATDPATVTTS
jgi:hypothetical protein